MFQANDFDDEHWTAKEKDFYPQEIRKRRNTMPSLDGAISGSPVSSTPSVPFSAASFTAPAGIDNDVAEAKTRPRFVFNQIRTNCRGRIIVGHDLKCGGEIMRSNQLWCWRNRVRRRSAWSTSSTRVIISTRLLCQRDGSVSWKS